MKHDPPAKEIGMNVTREKAMYSWEVRHLAICYAFFLFLCFPLLCPATQNDDTVRLQDDSDWWSTNRNADSNGDVKAEQREFAESNFQILHINLGNTMFSRTAAKLGRAVAIERGDASTGRRQVCYLSPNNQDKVHLIFEQGEVEYALYLFSEGPDWEGADRCVATKAVSRNLATASGIHLGQTPAQVIAILGKPTQRRKNELVYSFLVKKKTRPQDINAAKQRDPQMSDKELEETYGYYNLGAGLVAKFKNSRLIYLAVSKVESY